MLAASSRARDPICRLLRKLEPAPWALLFERPDAEIMPVMISLIVALLVTSARDGANNEIVVTARSGRCVVEVAKRPLSSQDFARLEKIWSAGTPVRVIEPRGANDRCLTKIMFELAGKGFTRVEFVEQADDR